jgi:hypothetical protein
MAGTALDLSGINVSQAVEKMNDQALSAAKFDFEMKEKKRLEFMSDMELSELNQNLSFRNAEIAIQEMDAFKDKWQERYSERDGRLNDRDRMEMLKDKTTVENKIRRINGIQKTYEEALQRVRSDARGQWDAEAFEDLSKKWIENGEAPPDGNFLELRPVNWRNYLSTQRPMTAGSQRSEDKVWNPNTRDWDIAVRTQYATDEERDHGIEEFVLGNPQVRKGLEKDFASLSDNDKQRYIDMAKEEGKNPMLLYAQEEGRGLLWQDNVNTARRDDPRYANYFAGRSGGSDLKPVAGRNVTLGTATYDEGFHLSQLRLTLLPGTIFGRAINLETGEQEEINSTEPISNLIFYQPKTGKMVVQVRKKGYRPFVIEGGQKQYAVIRQGGVIAFTGTKEDAEKEAEKYPRAKVEAMREKSQTAEVNYEIDVNDHPAVMEMIKRFNLPKTKGKSLY